MAETDRADDDLYRLLDELDKLLKGPAVTTRLNERGVNSSLALLISDALRSYVKGDKKGAAEDLATAAEEIAARLSIGGQRNLPS
jgi:hypothetical protein